MRQLHPVSLHEKFVASGIYSHFRDNKPMRLLEHWSIHKQPDGAQIVRVDLDGRDYDGRSILIEAWCNPDQKIERFDLNAYGTADDTIKEVKANYLFFDHDVQIGRIINSDTRYQEEMTLPPDTIIYPQATLFMGHVVAQSATRNEKEFSTFTYNPFYAYSPYKIEDAFKGEVQVYDKPRFLREQELETAGQIFQSRCYEWPYPIVDEQPVICLDRYQTLLQYDGPGNSRILLTQYAQRPEPKKHS
jgi:hypothetical protein